MPRPGNFTGEFYQYLKEELMQIFNFFPNIEEEGVLPISFCEVTITPVVKLDKDIKRKVNYPTFFHDIKNIQQTRNRRKLS